jgi:hypothetical protein
MLNKIGLKFGDHTIASLKADPNGKITLEHDLTVDDLDQVVTVDPIDESNQPLKIAVGNIRSEINVALYDGAGAESLGIGRDKYGYLDVVDPKGIAGLNTALALVDRGSTGNQPIKEGDHVLRLGPFQKARIYCDRVSRLYGQVELWLKDTSLQTRQTAHVLSEELFGKYRTSLLEIYDPYSKLVATLQPTGASVIGAEGRVELRGRIAREGVVYFPAGGPQARRRVGVGPSATWVSHPVFKGVSDEGWYWLESARLSRARPLDKDLFMDLLKGVSDYYEVSAP